MPEGVACCDRRGVHCALNVTQWRGDLVDEGATGIGQRDAAGGTVEEADAEARLELPWYGNAAERRGGHAEVPSEARQPETRPSARSCRDDSVEVVQDR